MTMTSAASATSTCSTRPRTFFAAGSGRRNGGLWLPHRSSTTGLPDSVWNVSGVTNSVAARLMTTMTAASRARSQRTSSHALYAAMPPDTPTTTVRPRSAGARTAGGLTAFVARLGSPLRRPAARCRRSAVFFVFEWDLATNHTLQRQGGDLAVHDVGGASRPVVQPPRLARRDDRELVLVLPGRRNQG